MLCRLNQRNLKGVGHVTLTNSLLAEPEGSTSPIPELTMWHRDTVTPWPTSHFNNLFPNIHINATLPSPSRSSKMSLRKFLYQNFLYTSCLPFHIPSYPPSCVSCDPYKSRRPMLRVFLSSLQILCQLYHQTLVNLPPEFCLYRFLIHRHSRGPGRDSPPQHFAHLHAKHCFDPEFVPLREPE